MKPSMVLLYAVADRRAQRAPKPTRIMKKNYRLTESPLQRVSAQLALAILAASTAWSQGDTPNTPPVTSPESAATVPVKSDDSPLNEDEDVIQLSPFEVEASNSGYQASNTMSGTRLNAKIEDLASSITVVTKQQLDDFAAVDINDVFQYEANTEGMSQFTDFTVDRTFYVENTTQNPQSSNRVRGLSSANISVNNFPTFGTVPVDTYIADSIEISRGPNSNIFGLGNASGTVSVNVGDASTSNERSRVIARADSYGGWRSSVDFNRVLKKDKLGIRVAALRDEKGFERKPSYEDIGRVFASFTARPFKGTTIRGAYESYRNRFSRANTTLPRDSITEWMAAGMPVWNPTHSATGGAWRLLGGSTYTPVAYANDGSATGLPAGLLPGNLNSGIWTTPALLVQPDGSVSGYFLGTASNSLTAPTAPGSPVFRYVETGSSYRRGSTASGVPLPLFQSPSITDQSIYDWEDINFLATNYGRDKADTYRVQINHIFLTTARHLLAAEVGQYREVVDRYDHSVFSRSDSGTPFLLVDVNETNIDGTPNPNFLRPFMGGSQPTTKATDQRNVATRGSVAYRLDLSNERGLLRWAGVHTFNIYAERRDMLTTSLTLRDINTTDYAWTSVADRAGFANRGNAYRIFPRYYLGDRVDQGGRIFDSAPASRFSLGSTPFSWYNSARTRIDEVATMEEIVTSGSSRDREIRSKGIIWQGSFWSGRIIPTVGWRADRNRERSSRNLNSNATQASTTVDLATRKNDLRFLNLFPNPWEEKIGQSRTQGIVVKPTRWLNLNYNQSDGFKPENLAYDINGRLLPNPVGEGKDYGITLKLLDEKLVARITRYETEEKYSRNGSITSAVVTRNMRLFFDPANSQIGGATPVTTYAALPNGSNGENFDLEQVATQWVIQQGIASGNFVSINEAREIAVDTYLKPMGIDQEYIQKVRTLGANAFTDVNTVTSTGMEVEISYNPNRYWTMKLTGAQQKAIDTELGNAVTEFIDSRSDFFRNIIVPTTPVTTANGTAGQKWWLVGATNPQPTGTAYPGGFYVANVKAPVGLATANAGKRRSQTREYRFNFTTNYKLGGFSDATWAKNTSVGGAVRWSSKAALGFYGMPPNADPEFRGAITDYDPERPIYDEARAEIDLHMAYSFKLWNDRTTCKLQFNVKNLTEDGRLQPIAYNPDGQAWNYRIVDPRQFILTATFDF
jgi:hypothetical protein